MPLPAEPHNNDSLCRDIDKMIILPFVEAEGNNTVYRRITVRARADDVYVTFVFFERVILEERYIAEGLTFTCTSLPPWREREKKKRTTETAETESAYCSSLIGSCSPTANRHRKTEKTDKKETPAHLGNSPLTSR